jgi:cytochrome c-type biogenesis protein
VIEYLFEVLGNMTNVIQPFLYDQQFSFMLFAIVMAAGLIAGITPFGLTTIVFFVGQLDKENEYSRKKGLLSSSLFSLGAAASLLLVGMAAAYIGKVMVNYSLAKFFPLVTLLMGLQMMGIWKWRTLPRIELTNSEGKANTFFVGLPFGVITPPCTAPIIVTILSLVASNGHLLFSLLTLLAFSLGRAIPLIVAATYGTTWLGNIKLKEKWNVMLNKTLGGVMILASVYFLTWGQIYFGT